MPAHSRVWVYQSDRKLSAAEIEAVSEKTKQFLETWTAHDQKLKASFEIRYNLFLILMIDEKVAGASGCSIDKSVHFIQSLEKEFNFSLLNRMLFAVKKRDSVEVLSKNNFEKQLVLGELNDNTIVFNNLVQTREELKTKWEVPMIESWHKKLA